MIEHGWQNPGSLLQQQNKALGPSVLSLYCRDHRRYGLALVSRIVEGLGGTVWVRTAREGGAAFVICLPIAAAPEADVDVETVELVGYR